MVKHFHFVHPHEHNWLWNNLHLHVLNMYIIKTDIFMIKLSIMHISFTISSFVSLESRNTFCSPPGKCTVPQSYSK